MVAGVIFRDEHFKMMAVGESRLHWMCKPGLETGERKPLRIQVLQNYRIITQGPQSGSGMLIVAFKPGMQVDSSFVELSIVTSAGRIRQ